MNFKKSFAITFSMMICLQTFASGSEQRPSPSKTEVALAATFPFSIPVLTMASIAMLPLIALDSIANEAHTYKVYDRLREKMNLANTGIQIDTRGLSETDSAVAIEKGNLLTQLFQTDTQLSLLESQERKLQTTLKMDETSLDKWDKEDIQNFRNRLLADGFKNRHLSNSELAEILAIARHIVKTEMQQMYQEWRTEKQASDSQLSP